MMSHTNKYMIATATALLIALPFLAAAADSKPARIDWDKKLAKGYRDLDFGDYDKAMDFFQKEVDHHPESGAARTGVGLACKKKGKAAEAIAHFRRATEVEPDYAEAHYELGAMLENDKNYSEACKCFERYLQLAPISSKRASVEDRIRNCKQNM
jgi:protein O-mannosyl-transferase